MAKPFQIRAVTQGRGPLCRAVLEALPDWFGIPEAIDDYVAAADRQPMFAAYDGAKAIGFASLCQHFAYSFEVHSMGVLQPYHRSGLGRALIAKADAFVAAQNGRFLSVKTLGPGWDDENYARTRAFYLGVGFVEIEEFATLWGDMPCLFLLKSVTNS